MPRNDEDADVIDMFVVSQHSCYEKETNDRQCDIWYKAIQDEITALREHQTWKLVSFPKQARKVIDYRWVYKLMPKTNATKEKFKAGLVAKGFQQ